MIESFKTGNSMNMIITSLTAATAGLILVVLSLRVIFNRWSELKAIGSSSKKLERKIRAHANFCEYTPIVMILLALCEHQQINTNLLSVVSVGFITGRLLHAYGISQLKEILIFRQVGMVTTFLSIIILSLSLFLKFS